MYRFNFLLILIGCSNFYEKFEQKELIFIDDLGTGILFDYDLLVFKSNVDSIYFIFSNKVEESNVPNLEQLIENKEYLIQLKKIIV
jgi:hypothetical protein